MQVAPRVFISYSHDDDAHKARVLALADRLCNLGGVDARIDRYVEPFPEEGWARWCWKQIEEADFVLMVCTATYLRRVSEKEEAGKGHGVCWEAPMIFQLLYEQASVSKKFVPCLFDGGVADHVPLPVRKFGRFFVDADGDWKQLLFHLHGKQPVPQPPIGLTPDLMPAPRPGLADALGVAPIAGTAAPLPPAAPAEPASQAARLFVGRVQEREMLAGLLLRPGGRRLPVVVSGMPGVGKSYLVDKVFAENRDDFPGGYVRLSLDPEALPGAAGLLAQVADRLQLPTADGGAVAARLADPPTLLHVENIDTGDAGRLAAGLAAACPETALVFTARLRGLGTAAGWGQIPLAPFGDDDALAQLRAELGDGAPHQQDWPELVTALGRLPLALHLAAGYLMEGGETPKSFLELLRAKGLELEPIDPADPAFQERSKARLSATFDLSLAVLRRQGDDAGVAWDQGLLTLGWATASGVGKSLGAAIAGLEEGGFRDMAGAAARLSLLERVARPDGPAFRLHPLLAELGRSRSDGPAAIARMTEWFCARLPKPGDGEPWRWNDVHAETPALLDWLAQVPPAERVRVERAGSRFATRTGPFHAWLRFCEAALADDLDDGDRSNVLWTLGKVALRAGLPDRALAAAEAKRELDRRRGADRDAAQAAGLIADIRTERGELDEALRIRREEQLAAFERLGDVYSRAVTMGKIADILQRREPDEALRIRLEEELPVYECLGDVRSRAVAMGKIADILQRREPDEALRIRREEELPVFERLGDVREWAVTMGKIADMLADRGDLDGAIDSYRRDVLPAYERIGELSMLVVDRHWLAKHLLRRNRVGDRDEARQLLCLALADARRMRIPEAGTIEAILAKHTLACDPT